MVAMSTGLAYRSFELDASPPPREETYEHGQSGQTSPDRGNLTVWAGSRETNRASGRGRTFFLTSLFIELIEDPAPRVNAL